MRRVSVVGNSGSGKSTLARELAARLGVPHLELDGVFHQPGWEPLPEEEFQRLVEARTSQDGWVIDGNYSVVQTIVWARADTVVWLDLPKRTVMRQVAWRTVRRAVTQQELWNGNREPLTNFLSWVPEKSIISWAWHNHAKYRTRYGAAAADPANAHLTFIRLTSRRDAGFFLADPLHYAQPDGLLLGRLFLAAPMAPSPGLPLHAVGPDLDSADAYRGSETPIAGVNGAAIVNEGTSGPTRPRIRVGLMASLACPLRSRTLSADVTAAVTRSGWDAWWMAGRARA